MSVDFIKMHGLGNDFVIIDGRDNGFLPSQEFCLRVADRHRGVGYDQLIVLDKPKNPTADLYMHIYNCDGSPAGACGNATRCVAKLLFKETGKQQAVIQTVTELLNVWQESDDIIAVEFGPPKLEWQDIPLEREQNTLCLPFIGLDVPEACCVNVGNPHAVFFVPDAMDIPLKELGPQLEHDSIFPNRCNIEFAQILDPTHIRMCVWERGTGITQACGSAALATLVAAVRRGLSQRKATIHMDGGDLMIEWRKSDEHIILSGTATLSFTGTLSEELVSGIV
ncbi:MAG: diaminopimelate epimerase [Alphaproteobacteria bacterium]|nr:diaminopimelate epimerase [Alphaproteobacteria bacterium]